MLERACRDGYNIGIEIGGHELRKGRAELPALELAIDEGLEFGGGDVRRVAEFDGGGD